jgi:hypothetical protein
MSRDEVVLLSRELAAEFNPTASAEDHVDVAELEEAAVSDTEADEMQVHLRGLGYLEEHPGLGIT